MIDEVSVYLRKVERAYPGASGQFTAFLHALFKAVETAPNVALVFTLAVGKDAEAKDAYLEQGKHPAGTVEPSGGISPNFSTFGPGLRHTVVRYPTLLFLSLVLTGCASKQFKTATALSGEATIIGCLTSIRTRVSMS